MINIIFRVDSSRKIGSGHLIRCRTLAESLQRKGANVKFICRDLPGNLIYLLEDRFSVIVLPARSASCIFENDIQHLGVSQLKDADETISSLVDTKPDWLIIDHYDLDWQWEEALYPYVKQIMVIDDLANRGHSCNVLLDQNEVLDRQNRYQDLVPESCLLLLGAKYALVRPEYVSYRSNPIYRSGSLKDILVFFGGSDLQNITEKALIALSDPALKSILVDVVVGASNSNKERLERLATERPNTKIHGYRPHLADLMAKADLAIGAGGATTWERCCLGLPALVVSLAENQVPICQNLDQKGIIQYLGKAEEVTSDKIRENVLYFSREACLLVEMSNQARTCVDGLGTIRVSQYLEEST